MSDEGGLGATAPPVDLVPLGAVGFPTVVAEPICAALTRGGIAFRSEPPYDAVKGRIAWPLVQRVLDWQRRGFTRAGRARFALTTPERTVLILVRRGDVAVARDVARRYADETALGRERT